MDLYVVLLRIVHIVAGVAWVGGFMLFFFFLQTSARDLGPQAAPFMTHLVQVKKMPRYLVIVGVTTILAGLLLFWRASNGLDTDWLRSSTGLTFTLGAIAAILALVNGLVGIKPVVDRIGAIGQAVAATGAPPSEAQAGEIQALQRRARSLSWVNLLLFIFAVVAMAIARYV